MPASIPAVALSASLMDSKTLVGDWYGEGQPNSPQVMFLVHEYAGGTFTIEFRDCSSGRAVDHVESGDWSYADDKETVVTEALNGRKAHFVDQYLTVSYDGRNRRYQLIASDSLASEIGFVFSAVRVDKSFTLSDCKLTS